MPTRYPDDPVSIPQSYTDNLNLLVLTNLVFLRLLIDKSFFTFSCIAPGTLMHVLVYLYNYLIRLKPDFNITIPRLMHGRFSVM